MKSFSTTFANLPTVLLLLIPVGVTAMPLRPVLTPGHGDLPLQHPIDPSFLAPPTTRVRAPSPPTYPSAASVLPPTLSATPRTPTHANAHKRRLEALHDNDPQPHSNPSTLVLQRPLNTPPTTAPRSSTTHPLPSAQLPPPRLSTLPLVPHHTLQRALLQLAPPHQPLCLPPLRQPPCFPQTAISSKSATQQPPPTTRAMTATPGNRGQAPTAQVPPQTTFLSTREQASLILITIFVCCVLASAGLRAHIPPLLRMSLRPAILLPLLLMLAHASVEVWIGFQLRWWSPILTKETVVWTFASGAVLLYKGILHANQEPHFFRKTASATIAPTVFLTFFMNLTALGLLAELALQLFLIPVAMLSTFAHASSDQEHHAVGKLCDGILSLVGLSWFMYTAIHVQNTWHQLDGHLLAQKLFLPMWLTLGLLPFIYVLSLYVAYQRPLGIIKNQTHVFRVRCRAIVAIILTLGVKARDVTRLQHFWIKQLVDAKTFAATRSAVRKFQRSLRADERATMEENDRLRRYAGVDGVDSEGRRLDRREFKETIQALHWLATCHTGHYRKRNRYDRNLLHLLGDSFTTFGLPKEAEITMKVAKSGQRWFAYRRTVSGWCFAIGAAGPPPDQWEYDGPDPPSGFPGEDHCWGNRPFEDTANRNWG